MKKPLEIVFLTVMGLLLSCFPVAAFFPIPVPIIGTDTGNNTMDKGENLTAKAEWVEQKLTAAQKKIEGLKSGNLGLDAIGSFDEMKKNIGLDKLPTEIKLPDKISGVINDNDQSSAAINNLYTNTLSENGGHTEQAKANNQKRIELLQLNISTLYAHALATRVHLSNEKEKLPDTTFDSENTRELIQSSRAFSEKIAKRWNDILFMETQIAEYEATKVLTSFSLDAEEAADRGVTTEGEK